MTYVALLADDNAERAFCADVEAKLRIGDVDGALATVRGALATLAERGQPLAERCLARDAGEVTITGWDDLAAEIEGVDRTVTALGVDLSWPGHIGATPDEDGALTPLIETNLYSDASAGFVFSTAECAALLAGYADGSAAWQGGMEDVLETLELDGIGDLYGPIYALERSTGQPGADRRDRDMAVVGSCFVAVLLHAAVRRAVLEHGLPHAMAVIVGSNEAFPYFDAPVVSAEEYRATADA